MMMENVKKSTNIICASIRRNRLKKLRSARTTMMMMMRMVILMKMKKKKMNLMMMMTMKNLISHQWKMILK
jgi:hypothetical protein